MTDIVKLLRDYDPTRRNSRVAAAEIERLRSLVESQADDVERLVAEIERMRANEKAQMDGALALLAADKNLRDEIERLRSTINQLHAGGNLSIAEIDRLRAALDTLACWYPDCPSDAEEMAAFARGILKGQ